MENREITQMAPVIAYDRVGAGPALIGQCGRVLHAAYLRRAAGNCGSVSL